MNGRSLYNKLVDNFSERDFRELCFQLNFEFDHLRGDTVRSKMMDFAQTMQRHNRLNEVADAMAQFEQKSIIVPKQASTDSASIKTAVAAPAKPTPQPEPEEREEPTHNPYTIAKLIELFFTEAEKSNLLASLPPTNKEKKDDTTYSLIVIAIENEQIETLISKAKSIHPELPWDKIYISFKSPPSQPDPDIKKIRIMIQSCFNNVDELEQFLAQHAPEAVHSLKKGDSYPLQVINLVKYQKRRKFIPSLLALFETHFPKNYAQFDSYERVPTADELAKKEKEHEGRKKHEAKTIIFEYLETHKDMEGLRFDSSIPTSIPHKLSGILWSLENDHLLCRDFTNRTEIWDTSSKTCVGSINIGKTAIRDAAINTEGTQIGLLKDVFNWKKAEVKFYDVTSGNEIGVIHEDVLGNPKKLALSPDGKTAVTAGHDNTVSFWKANTLALIKKAQESPMPTKYVAFSRDSKLLFSAGNDGKIYIWNPEEGKRLTTLVNPTNSEIIAMAVSPGGDQVAIVQRSSRKIIVWGIEQKEKGFLSKKVVVSGKIITELAGFTNNVQSLSFSATGRLLAANGDTHKLKIWRTDNWQLRTDALGNFGQILFHPKRPFLASTLGKEVRLWEVVPI